MAEERTKKRDKHPYVRVSHDGSSCVMEGQEAEALLKEEPGVYDTTEVWMTRAEFGALPDFSGW